MKIITLTNNKGGVTKTTSSINLGYALALQNFKVGLIDFDSQKNLSFNIENAGGSTLEQCLNNKSIKLSDFATTNNSNLYVLKNKGNVTLSVFSQFNADEQPYLLLDCLENLEADAFDFIIIDTPPNLELQTINSLIASDYALIPATLETNSIIGVDTTLQAIKRIQSRLNPKINLLGVFISKYDERLTSTNNIMSEKILSLVDETKYIKSKIRTNSNYAKNQAISLSIFESKDARGIDDYNALSQELLKEIN